MSGSFRVARWYHTKSGPNAAGLSNLAQSTQLFETCNLSDGHIKLADTVYEVGGKFIGDVCEESMGK